MTNQLVKQLGTRSAAYFHNLGGVDEAIKFLEKDEWDQGSGYAKADLLRLLRRLDLNPAQAERLRRIILAVVEGRDRREFRHYCRLACKVDSPELRKQLEHRLESENELIRRHARWVLEYLSKHQTSQTDLRSCSRKRNRRTENRCGCHMEVKEIVLSKLNHRSNSYKVWTTSHLS